MKRAKPHSSIFARRPARGLGRDAARGTRHVAALDAGRGAVLDAGRGAALDAGRGTVLDAGRGAVLDAGRGTALDAKGDSDRGARRGDAHKGERRGAPTARSGVRPGAARDADRRAGNSVRIIGGAWRGRRVHFPDAPGLRPTPDRVRETLFNWLQRQIAGTRCLDLFAGSGALGLEALSRGAREVIFVESASQVAQVLRRELGRLGGAERATIFEGPAERYLAMPGKPFDGVFLDPPFGQGRLAETLLELARGSWLEPGGWVYLEAERTAGVPVLPPSWDLVKSKAAGEVGYHLARISDRIGQ